MQILLHNVDVSFIFRSGYVFITFALKMRKFLFWLLFIYLYVCVFVCVFLCYSHNSKSIKPNRMKFSGMIVYYPGTIWLDFGIDRVKGQGHEKVNIFFESHEIWLDDWLSSGDHLMTFWDRSGQRSRSTSYFYHSTGTFLSNWHATNAKMWLRRRYTLYQVPVLVHFCCSVMPLFIL